MKNIIWAMAVLCTLSCGDESNNPTPAGDSTETIQSENKIPTAKTPAQAQEPKESIIPANPKPDVQSVVQVEKPDYVDWPNKDEEWSLVARKCDDGTELLAGEGSLSITVDKTSDVDNKNFKLAYSYRHNRIKDPRLVIGNCSFTSGFIMVHDTKNDPNMLNYQKGSIFKSGISCLGKNSPDYSIYKEWTAKEYRLDSMDGEALVIETRNDDLCDSSLVLNVFEPNKNEDE